MNLREIARGGKDWIDLAQDKNKWRAAVNVVMTFGFHTWLGSSWAAA